MSYHCGFYPFACLPEYCQSSHEYSSRNYAGIGGRSADFLFYGFVWGGRLRTFGRLGAVGGDGGEQEGCDGG